MITITRILIKYRLIMIFSIKKIYKMFLIFNKKKISITVIVILKYKTIFQTYELLTRTSLKIKKTLKSNNFSKMVLITLIIISKIYLRIRANFSLIIFNSIKVYNIFY